MKDTRNFYTLLPGERFKAVIADIKPGQVTIRLEGGGTFTARTLVLPESRIGEESIFAVKENHNGQILLEMVKLDTQVKQQNMLSDALRNAGMQVNSDNLALGKIMVDANIPVDASALQRAAFFRYTQGDIAQDKLLFLLREKMPADPRSVQWLNTASVRGGGLRRALNNLIGALTDLNDTDLLNTLLPGAQITKNLPASLRKHLFLDGGRWPELRGYYAKLAENTDAIIRWTEGHPDKRLTDILAALRGQLNFMGLVMPPKQYYQIPFVTEHHTQSLHSELFIFPQETVVTVETEQLGRIEVFIQKAARQVNVKVLSSSTNVLPLMNKQKIRLAEMLSEKGYTLSNFSSQTIEKAFTLLTAAPGEEQSTPKRYAFDMRV